MTFNELARESSLMMASVIPSEKYSWPGSAERLARGNTATDVMVGATTRLDLHHLYPAMSAPPSTSATTVAVTMALRVCLIGGEASARAGASWAAPEATRRKSDNSSSAV